VCDDSWDTNDCTDVCNQLGFYGAVSSYCCATFGQGVDPIWLDNVQCTGTD
jgi:deleted-in-malignant-brain-tumors protein 1